MARIMWYAFVCVVLVLSPCSALAPEPRGRSADELIAALPPCASTCTFNAFVNSACPDKTLSGLPDCYCRNVTLQKEASMCFEDTCSTLRDTALGIVTWEQICVAYPKESRSNDIFVMSIIAIVVSIPIVLARCAARLHSSKNLFMDDWAAVLAMLSLVAIAAIGIVMSQNGFGMHLWNVHLEKIQTLLQLFYVQQLLYIIIQALAKISILLLFARVFSSLYFERTVNAFILLVICHTVVFLALIGFQCWPVESIWNKAIQGRCVNVTAVGYVGAVVSIVEDIAIILLPINEIRRLQVTGRKRVVIFVLFAIGSFAAVTSIVRLKFLVMFAYSFDTTWDTVDVLIWSTIELLSAVVFGSLPPLRNWLGRLMPTDLLRRYSRRGDTGNNKALTPVSPTSPTSDKMYKLYHGKLIKQMTPREEEEFENSSGYTHRRSLSYPQSSRPPNGHTKLENQGQSQPTSPSRYPEMEFTGDNPDATQQKSEGGGRQSSPTVPRRSLNGMTTASTIKAHNSLELRRSSSLPSQDAESGQEMSEFLWMDAGQGPNAVPRGNQTQEQESETEYDPRRYSYYDTTGEGAPNSSWSEIPFLTPPPRSHLYHVEHPPPSRPLPDIPPTEQQRPSKKFPKLQIPRSPTYPVASKAVPSSAVGGGLAYIPHGSPRLSNSSYLSPRVTSMRPPPGRSSFSPMSPETLRSPPTSHPLNLSPFSPNQAVFVSQTPARVSFVSPLSPPSASPGQDASPRSRRPPNPRDAKTMRQQVAESMMMKKYAPTGPLPPQQESGAQQASSPGQGHSRNQKSTDSGDGKDVFGAKKGSV